ncbi:MAG: HD-GYP domain-containing protein [Actinomycetota bacterium]
MGRPTTERQPGDAGPRWAGRPFLAAVVRLAVLLVPIAAGVAPGVVLARLIPQPSGVVGLAWILAVLAGSTLTVTAVERLGRRLLPLATLLNLSLAFPDRAPSRFKLARQAGNIRILHERARHAREHGLDRDPARAAETVLTLVSALSAHDRKTRGHSERVRALTDMVAAEFDVSPADRDRLRWAALLHDVGKLEVPSETLNKPGKPDEDEWEVLRRHPLEGERISAPLLPWLGEWAAVIGQHHERWDGAGYPRGLSGEQLVLGARIVSVADSFEVMTAARSYKRPMTPNAARRELQRCAGKQFDPQVVRAFLGISVGRLWLTVGPASWVAQIPFMLGIGRTGGQAITLARAAGTVAINGLAGVLALGVGAAAAAPTPRVETTAAVATAHDSTSTITDASGSGVIDDEIGQDDEGLPTNDDASQEDEGGDAPPGGEGDEGGVPEDAPIDPGDDDGIVEEVEGTGDDVDDVVDNTVETVEETLETVEEIVETVDDAVDDVLETVEETVETVEDVVEDTAGGLDDTLGDVLGGLG